MDVWFPESEIMMARSNTSNRGFFIAAKAGHNAESHNHNDIGNFIVYYNAVPVLVDAGVGTYTAKTFSNERYSIWNMQSIFHNLPTFNGHMQSAGRSYKATNVNYKSNNKYARFKMDLKEAYPQDAGINTLVRTIQLNRNKNIILTDKYALKNNKGISTISFITPCNVTITEPGEIRLLLLENGKKRTVYINYDAAQFSVEKEPINMEGEENERLRNVWTDGLTRILLTDKRNSTTGTWKFLISSY
jgi:hypothetical protein